MIARNKRSGPRPRILTPGKIFTSEDENRVYVFNAHKGIPTYVQEVPAARYNGISLCLATKNKAEIPKIKVMCERLSRFWANLPNQHGIIIP